jgi:uncharacterized membrane protein YozB (DUF420 family)
MLEWLKQPGFLGTHATLGADVSQLMAALFTALFVIGWIQARRRRGERHHWLMLGGMVAMVAFFTSYYLFRQLGVLAFEGKEGFGGSEVLYRNVFIPLLTFHIILVIVGLVMAVYMIVLGFRTQMYTMGQRLLRSELLVTSWTKIGKLLGSITALVSVYLVFLFVTDRLSSRRLALWAAMLLLVTIVFALEMAIQRIWPNGERRHRVLGTFTMIIYCVLFVTGSVTYTMLYILYPGKIG